MQNIPRHLLPARLISGSLIYSSARTLLALLLSVHMTPLIAAEIPSHTQAMATAQPNPTYKALAELPKLLQGDPERLQKMQSILKEAERVRDLPIVQRAASLEELRNPQGRRIGNIDKRALVVEKTSPQKANIFAVASSDLDNTAMIAAELPLMAAAYAVTGEHSYLDRIITQLRETVHWEPLQRPGWELYTADHNLPPDGNDGVWLATGQGLAAIWQTLELLPDHSLPSDLMEAIQQQFKREAARVTDDWQHKRMWFVKKNIATTNQWIVPAAGQALACSVLGKETDPVSYELAISNLKLSLEGLGADGSGSEGAEYSQHWTAPFLYMAAQALAKHGDQRLISHPFFKKFPTWAAMQYQPGQWIINTFDNFGGARGLFYKYSPDLTRLVILSQDRTLAWSLRHVIKVLPYDVYGLLSLTIPEKDLTQPPLWALYERGHTAIWRSSWEDAASGVWIKGADARDGHDHYDRGHVNFIANGKAVLIEAATAGYDNPQKRERYDSVMGHNVLQVGADLYPKKTPAPITIIRMDRQGGKATVDAGQGYPAVASWKREVTWTATQMEITDVVVLKSPEKVLFRWHLGSEQPLRITPSGDKTAEASLPAGRFVYSNPAPEKPSDWVPAPKESMETPAATFKIQSSQPIECVEEKNFDHAFRFRQSNHQHTTLLVRSTAPIDTITLKTTVDAGEPVSSPQ